MVFIHPLRQLPEKVSSISAKGAQKVDQAIYTQQVITLYAKEDRNNDLGKHKHTQGYHFVLISKICAYF